MQLKNNENLSYLDYAFTFLTNVEQMKKMLKIWQHDANSPLNHEKGRSYDKIIA